jgi:chromate reductase, NAD(P)H dehydrogenase (quinone)
MAEVPLHNQDVEADGDPEPVQALKRAIGEADALLIATPEYNHGVPGLLKNAIDWPRVPLAARCWPASPRRSSGRAPV